MGALRIQSYVEAMIQRYPFGGPILDTCAGWEPNWYEPLFPNHEYIKQDIRDFDPPCIDIICDITNLTPVESESVGLVLNLEALERIYKPQAAIDEIYRVLKPKGILILSTSFYYPFRPVGPEHERLGQKDYWRFTPEGVKFLLRRFKILDMTLEGSPTTFRGIWTPAQKITDEPERTQIYLANTAYEQNIELNVVPPAYLYSSTKAKAEREAKIKAQSMVRRCLRHIAGSMLKKLTNTGIVKRIYRFLVDLSQGT